MNRLKGNQPVLVAVGLAVLAALVLLVMVMPKGAALKKQQQALETAQQMGQQLTTQVAELRDAKQQAATVENELRNLRRAIPNSAALPGLITQVQHIADAAAVDFVQVSPGTPLTSSGNYSTVPTQIMTNGSYSAVTEFLYELENLPRDVKVTSINVGAGPLGLPQLSLNLTAEVYTTDTSSGPGSQPGPTASGGA
jgi:Tfp pilus assembly protein PilO